MVRRRAAAKAALICGSVAYDTILVFPDRFKQHILPDKIHILNVCLPGARDAPRIRRLRGQHRLQPAACSAMPACPWPTAGHDFGPYRERMRVAAA